METRRESIRKTVTIPPELWSKVRIEKIQKGDESLSDIVVRALDRYFRKFGFIDIAEFIYQAMIHDLDKKILSVMDITDEGFNESLETSGLLDIHDDLKRITGAA